MGRMAQGRAPGTTGAAPPASRVLVRTALCAALLVGGAACTGSDDSDDSGDTDTPGQPDGQSSLRVSTPVTRVAGRLDDADRLALRREVEALVRGWAEKGLLDPGAARRQAFPGFTPGARRLAGSQREVLWRLAGPSAQVTPRRLEGVVHAFAPDGTAQGATLHLDLALDVSRGDRSRRVRLTGRLLLTPVGDGWRVFGFDVRRSGR